MTKRGNSSRSGPIADRLQELAEFLSAHHLSEIEVEQGDLRIRLVRQIAGKPAPVASLTPDEPENGQTRVESEPEADEGQTVRAPMVGTAYRRPQPGSPPFVEIGQLVKAGTPLLVIEAMKTFSEVPAPHEGKVSAILFEDGQSVEYGQPLVRLT